MDNILVMRKIHPECRFAGIENEEREKDKELIVLHLDVNCSIDQDNRKVDREHHVNVLLIFVLDE